MIKKIIALLVVAAIIPLTIGPDGTVSEPTGIRFVN